MLTHEIVHVNVPVSTVDRTLIAVLLDDFVEIDIIMYYYPNGWAERVPP